MILALSLELYVDDTISDADQAEARACALDGDLLGIDVEDEWVAAAPFPEIVAHLLMFSPTWLFTRAWVRGWVAEPVNS